MRKAQSPSPSSESSNESRPLVGAPDDRHGSTHPWLTLAAVIPGLMMVMLDTSVVTVANATISGDLNASLTQLQWVSNAYLLALASGMIIGGKLGDLLGRKRMFLTGVSLFALASLACGLSGRIELLIAFRVVQGLGGAMMMPQTLAILRAAFPPARLQKAVGVWAGSSSLAIASGPIIGGLLVQHVSWQSIFYINVVIGAVAVPGGLRYIPESRGGETARGGLDVAGTLLLAGTLFCLIWALVKSPTYGWISTQTLGFFAGAAILLAGWVLRMATADRPLVPLALFRVPTLDAGMGVVIAAAFSLLSVLFYVTLYLQRVHGMSPVEAGVHMLPLTGLIAVSAPIGGIAGKRIPLRVQVAAGLLLVSGGLLGLRNLEPDSPFNDLWPWLIMIGAGMGLVMTGGSQAIVGSAPVTHAGIAGGLQNTSTQLGGALGISVLGSIVASRVGTVLPDDLRQAGVPSSIAQRVPDAGSTVTQGAVPAHQGVPPKIADAITQASYHAQTTGMHTAFLVAACVAAGMAIIALVVVKSPAHRQQANHNR